VRKEGRDGPLIQSHNHDKPACHDLDGKPVSALLSTGFEDVAAALCLHAAAKTVASLPDPFGWRVQMYFHGREIITQGLRGQGNLSRRQTHCRGPG
jgi:hypothetical protein